MKLELKNKTEIEEERYVSMKDVNEIIYGINATAIKFKDFIKVFLDKSKSLKDLQKIDIDNILEKNFDIIKERLESKQDGITKYVYGYLEMELAKLRDNLKKDLTQTPPKKETAEVGDTIEIKGTKFYLCQNGLIDCSNDFFIDKIVNCNVMDAFNSSHYKILAKGKDLVLKEI